LIVQTLENPGSFQQSLEGGIIEREMLVRARARCRSHGGWTSHKTYACRVGILEAAPIPR
jgi:hypothetical protein